MTTTPNFTVDGATVSPQPAQAQLRAAARRAPAVAAPPPFDGRHGGEAGIVWREVAPGSWKVTGQGGVAMIESDGAPTLAQALAALPQPTTELEARPGPEEPASEFDVPETAQPPTAPQAWTS